jgi:WD40 repeat protein
MIRRLLPFLSALKPTRLSVLFAVLIGFGVGFWQWMQPPRPRVVLKIDEVFPIPYFSPDGRILLTVHRNRPLLLSYYLSVWDTDSGEKKFDFREEPNEGDLDENGFDIWGGVAFSPDGQTMACVFVDKNAGRLTRKICLWDVNSGRRIKTFEENDNQPKLAFSPKGELLVLRKNSVLWVVHSNKMVKTLVFQGEEIAGHWGDDTILVRCKGPVFKVWNLATATLVSEGTNLHDIDFRVAATPSGRTKVFDESRQQKSWWSAVLNWFGAEVPTSDHFVILKSISTGEELIELKGCENPVFSPNGQILSTTSSKDPSLLQLFDFPVRKPIGKILGLTALAAVATLLAISGFGWLRRRRMRLKADLVPNSVPSTT